MKFKLGELVIYKHDRYNQRYRVRKVHPDFRKLNVPGYSLALEELGSYQHGKHFASVKEESIEKIYSHVNNV